MKERLVAVVRRSRRDQILAELSRTEAEQLLGLLGGGTFVQDEACGELLVLDDDVPWPSQSRKERQ